MLLQTEFHQSCKKYTNNTCWKFTVFSGYWLSSLCAEASIFVRTTNTWKYTLEYLIVQCVDYIQDDEVVSILGDSWWVVSKRHHRFCVFSGNYQWYQEVFFLEGYFFFFLFSKMLTYLHWEFVGCKITVKICQFLSCILIIS